MESPILVVDDEPDMRIALTHVLNRSGYLVDTASNGTEALLKFKKYKYCVVITDVKMPGMSGTDLLAALKKISSEVPVIIMSAYGTIGKAVEAMKMGASDYLLKPFSYEKMENLINKLISSNENKARDKSEEPFCKAQAGKKIITQNPRMLEIIEQAKNIASTNATVLIQGESGTGKELLALFIHQNSVKKNGAYIPVNCAALPEGLAESDLFGHEKGSFTGAVIKKVGKFELANNGTIVLDEISEMAKPLQAKLLRVLQENEVYTVGGCKPVPINARVIAISNVVLTKAVQEEKFREDLFYRVNVIPFIIPPLRERREDIPLLTDFFLSKYNSPSGKKKVKIAKDAVTLLARHDWKGNIRELENVIERAVLLGNGNVISATHLFLNESEIKSNPRIHIKAGLSVKEMEKELIVQTLKEVNNNRTHAADLLGISIRTLRNKLIEYQ